MSGVCFRIFHDFFGATSHQIGLPYLFPKVFRKI